MHVVLLRFAANKDRAGPLMEGHNAWIARGREEGVFALVGALEPKAGGALIVHGLSAPEVEARVAEDPFVAEGVVDAEILEITPGKTDPRLDFLRT